MEYAKRLYMCDVYDVYEVYGVYILYMQGAFAGVRQLCEKFIHRCRRIPRARSLHAPGTLFFSNALTSRPGYSNPFPALYTHTHTHTHTHT